MSNHWSPRFPSNQQGNFRGSNPRFQSFNRPQNDGFRPRHYNLSNRGFFQPRGGFQPRDRHPSPFRGYRPNFEFRGRGLGGRGGHGHGQSGFKDKGIEAYYKHSMVEDPWEELEQQKHGEEQQTT